MRALSFTILSAALVLAAAAEATADDLREHLGLAFHADGLRQLDLLLPPAGEHPVPVLLWIVGAGASGPTREAQLALGRQLARRGLGVARLECGSNEDAAVGARIAGKAMPWLRQQAEHLGIAADRWAVMGSGPAAPAAARASAGPRASDRERLAADQAALAAPRALILLGGPGEASTFRRPGDAQAATLPPVHFLLGELDNPLRDAPARREMRAAGVRTSLRVFAEAGADFWLDARWRHGLADEVEAFLHGPLELPETEWSVALDVAGAGSLFVRPKAIEQRIEDPSALTAAEIPRFFNRMLRAQALHAGGATELSLQPGLQSWSLPIPEDLRSTGPLVVRINTAERPELAGPRRIVSCQDDGNLVLPAHQATAHGRLLRYEPQPHKNTVGYWADAADWCEWSFFVDQAGSFEVHVLQGCGKGQGGSRVRFELGEHGPPDAVLPSAALPDTVLPYTVIETGHFQNFQRHPVGTFEIDRPGVHTLRLRALHKAAGAVMDVREITLSPAR